METKKNTLNLLVLVPHRDIRVKLEKSAKILIKNGLSNIYSFPLAAPLAALSKPLSADELKAFAVCLRNITKNDKFTSEEMGAIELSTSNDDMLLHGPKLKFNLPQNVFDSLKITLPFSSSVIGVYLTSKANKQQISDNPASALLCEDIAFRAAAVANMCWQPIKKDNEICFKWKIDKLFWLPKHANVS